MERALLRGRQPPDSSPMMPSIRHDLCEFRPKPDSTIPAPSTAKGHPMAYNIVAERDNETVRMRRNSSIIAIAKARVWASEGWDVTIIDDDDNPLVPADDRRLLSA
ncbi:MAG TPA: hypothetical protein VJS63_07420 [Bradyrhizobium sp.]|nr:hypothetical protein [Bradyrhizobium sp.]